MSIFAEIAAQTPRMAYLAHRPVALPQRATYGRSELDLEVPVVLWSDGVTGDQLLRSWPDRSTAQDLQDALHDRDLERAAQPPQVVVTLPVAPVPTGPQRVLAPVQTDPGLDFSDLFRPRPASLPGPQRSTGRGVFDVTRRLRRAVRGSW